MVIDRGFHADGAQQLQRMVLHHVTQRAGGVIESATFFDADFLGNCDLDIGNRFPAPQRLKQRVAKTQGKQILYRWFAQIMIDSENLVFGQYARHRLVDSAVRHQVVPQWFFQYDTGVGGVEPRQSHVFAHGGEQSRGCSQVHDHHIGAAFVQAGSQLLVGRRV